MDLIRVGDTLSFGERNGGSMEIKTFMKSIHEIKIYSAFLTNESIKMTLDNRKAEFYIKENSEMWHNKSGKLLLSLNGYGYIDSRDYDGNWQPEDPTNCKGIFGILDGKVTLFEMNDEKGMPYYRLGREL